MIGPEFPAKPHNPQMVLDDGLTPRGIFELDFASTSAASDGREADANVIDSPWEARRVAGVVVVEGGGERCHPMEANLAGLGKALERVTLPSSPGIGSVANPVPRICTK